MSPTLLKLPTARTASQIAVATATLALSAQIDLPVPGSPVPQSAQTLALLFAAFALGAKLAVAAVTSYLALAALGLPVLAGGQSGVESLSGATAGYLVGFLLAAWIAGTFADRGRTAADDRERGTTAARLARLRGWLLAGLLAHAVILALGFLRLLLLVEPADAWGSGVAPFLWGAVAKSALAAGLAALVTRT